MIHHVSANEVIALHNALISRYDGLPGTHDQDRVHALIGRVLNHQHYAQKTDIFELAALYLVAISRGHIFNDGNKRTAFNTAMLFLRRNGIFIEDHWSFNDLTVLAARGEYQPQKVAEILRNFAFTHPRTARK